MRTPTPLLLLGLAALAAAAGPGAWLAAGAVERGSLRRAESALQAAGQDWARVDADGLRLTLEGAFPDPPSHRAALAALAAAAPLSVLRDASRPGAPEASPATPGAATSAEVPSPGLVAIAVDDAPAAVAPAAPVAAAPEAPPATPGPETPQPPPSAETVSAAEAAPPRTGASSETPPVPPRADVAAPAPLALVRDEDGLVIAGSVHPEMVAALRAALAAAPPREGMPGLALRDAAAPREDAPDAERLALARAAALTLAELPQGQAEIAPGLLTFNAQAPDDAARAAAEARLRERAPEGAVLLIDISAPLPQLAPFRFGIGLDAQGPVLLSCDMRSDVERRRVMEAASRLPGAAERARAGALCRLGVGAPSQRWADAAVAGIEALGMLEAGRFELIDGTARLVAASTASPAKFEAAARTLSAALPEGFALRLTPPPKRARLPASDDEMDDGRPLWFAARRRDDGVTLAGAAPDEASRAATAAFARSIFSGPGVEDGLALAETAPPPAWRRAALAGMQALASVDTGSVRFDGERLSLAGRSQRPAAAREAAVALEGMAEMGVEATAAVTIDLPALAARLPLPPASCLKQLDAASKAEPIGFDPGAAGITKESAGVLDRLAGILKRCEGLVVEIGGHTDSQGRESTNAALSEARAHAVLDALFTRGVTYARMTSRGYGESMPIADNGTEEGRAANRRIEFSDPSAAAVDGRTDDGAAAEGGGG